MSKLDDLIAELCPDGVEYVKIKKVYKRLKGTPITAGKMKEIHNPNGEIRIFAGGKTVINANECDIPKANITRVPAVLVQSRGIIDAIYYDKPFTFKNEMWAYTANSKIEVKYLYYVLKNNLSHFREAASGMGALPQISLQVTEEFIIPLPPLLVQQEIVRILDKFTALELELKTELKAELKNRKKQYEYYRDNLLTFGDDVEWKTLGEVGILVRGNGLQKKDFTESGVGCIHYGQIYTYYGTFANKTKSFVSLELAQKLKKVNKNDLIITNTSENVNDVCKVVAWLGDSEIVTGGHATILKHNENPKYLAYYMQTEMFYKEKRKYATGVKVIDVSATKLTKIKIPVPPLAEQERIVAILDRFDTLANDITQGACRLKLRHVTSSMSITGTSY